MTAEPTPPTDARASTGPIAEVKQRAGREREHAGDVRGMFARIAPTYDRLNELLSFGVDARWRRRAIDALADLPDGPTLDLCAGTMDLSRLLVQAFPERRVVASDFAAEMLERGRWKAPRAERVVADALDLPFATGTFAAVVCAFGVRNLADPAAGAREALRVLRPGGRLVVLEFFRPVSLLPRAFHAAYGDVVLPRVGGWMSGDREAYAYLSRSMKAFLSRREYEEALTAAGFVAVRGEELTLGVASLVCAEKPGAPS